MKQSSKSFILFYIFIFSNLFSLTTNAQVLNKPLEVYLGGFVLPLEIGNVWNYRNGYLQPEKKLSIIDTLRIEGEKYYLLKNLEPSGYFETYQYLRLRDDGYYASRVLDSNLTFFPNEDYLFYMKNATLGDIWSQKDFFDVTWYHIVLDTIQVSSFWGSFLPVKVVEITDSSLTTYLEYWSEEFGLVQQQNTDWFSGGWSYLWGCYINGQQYGDTVLVSVESEKQNFPSDFKLFQNYPNPFNPTTIISYSLPVSSQVTLKVFDVLGKEVITLVDGHKEAGIHKIVFDASNLSGGIYFYKIQSGNYTETRKLVLQK